MSVFSLFFFFNTSSLRVQNAVRVGERIYLRVSFCLSICAALTQALFAIFIELTEERMKFLW